MEEKEFAEFFGKSDYNKIFENLDSLMQDNKFHDEFADFTEFEDEHGEILLIKYDTKTYEFRGNTYCQYILCNEKTGSREEGIAQVKNGQKIHIKDQERINKIMSFICSEINKQEHEKLKQDKAKQQDQIIGDFLYALDEIGISQSDFDDFDDFLEAIKESVDEKKTYNGDEYWLYVNTVDKECVVWNNTKGKLIKDISLIRTIFDIDKYFRTNLPWWKKIIK